MTAALLAGWLSGVVLAPGLTPDEATRILHLYLINQANRRIRDEVRAAGLPAPDRPRLQRLSDEVLRVRALRVRRVHVRPEIFWSFSTRSYCIARMEMDGAPTDAPPVRYYRIVCAWMTPARIQWETTAAHFRFPI